MNSFCLVFALFFVFALKLSRHTIVAETSDAAAASAADDDDETTVANDAGSNDAKSLQTKYVAGEFGVIFEGLEERFEKNRVDAWRAEGRLLARLWTPLDGKFPPEKPVAGESRKRWLRMETMTTNGTVTLDYARFRLEAGTIERLTGWIRPDLFGSAGTNFWMSMLYQSRNYYKRRLRSFDQKVAKAKLETLFLMARLTNQLRPPKLTSIHIVLAREVEKKSARTAFGKDINLLAYVDLMESAECIGGPIYKFREHTNEHLLLVTIPRDALRSCCRMSPFAEKVQRKTIISTKKVVAS